MPKSRRKPHVPPIDFDAGIPGAFAVCPKTLHKPLDPAIARQASKRLGADALTSRKERDTHAQMHRTARGKALVRGGRAGRGAEVITDKDDGGVSRRYVRRIHPLETYQRRGLIDIRQMKAGLELSASWEKIMP